MFFFEDVRQESNMNPALEKGVASCRSVVTPDKWFIERREIDFIAITKVAN